MNEVNYTLQPYYPSWRYTTTDKEGNEHQLTIPHEYQAPIINLIAELLQHHGYPVEYTVNGVKPPRQQGHTFTAR